MGSKEFITLCKKHVVGYFNENATLWRKSRKKRCHTGFSGGCSEKVCPAPQNALQELVYIQC